MMTSPLLHDYSRALQQQCNLSLSPNNFLKKKKKSGQILNCIRIDIMMPEANVSYGGDYVGSAEVFQSWLKALENFKEIEDSW